MVNLRFYWNKLSGIVSKISKQIELSSDKKGILSLIEETHGKEKVDVFKRIIFFGKTMQNSKAIKLAKEHNMVNDLAYFAEEAGLNRLAIKANEADGNFYSAATLSEEKGYTNWAILNYSRCTEIPHFSDGHKATYLRKAATLCIGKGLDEKAKYYFKEATKYHLKDLESSLRKNFNLEGIYTSAKNWSKPYDFPFMEPDREEGLSNFIKKESEELVRELIISSIRYARELKLQGYQGVSKYLKKAAFLAEKQGLESSVRRLEEKAQRFFERYDALYQKQKDVYPPFTFGF